MNKREAVVEVYIAGDGRWHFRLVGANYEIMSRGEGYVTEGSAKRGVRRVAQLMATAKIRVVVD